MNEIVWEDQTLDLLIVADGIGWGIVEEYILSTYICNTHVLMLTDFG